MSVYMYRRWVKREGKTLSEVRSQWTALHDEALYDSCTDKRDPPAGMFATTFASTVRCF